MRRERKHYTGVEKVAILGRHLLDKVPDSDLYDELGLQPTVFTSRTQAFLPRDAPARRSSMHTSNLAANISKHKPFPVDSQQIEWRASQ